MFRAPALLPVFMLFVLFQHAHAARPFMTDDARLTTAGSCQLESWSRFYRSKTELWALPACNPTGNFELTVGGDQSRATGEPRTGDLVVQGKSLFREMTSGGWGWGLAVGTTHHPSSTSGPNGLGNHYAYLPISISTLNDRVIVHTNVGLLRDKASHQDRKTYGIGAEIAATSRLLLIAETFGDHTARPYWQTGVRYSVIPNLFQVDATIGQQFNGPSSGRWLSFGLRYTPDKFF